MIGKRPLSWEPPIGIEPMTYALREAREYAAAPLPAQTARRTAPEALIALGFRDYPFHDSFHAWLATAWRASLHSPIQAARLACTC